MFQEVLTGSSDLCEQLKHSRVEPSHVAYQLYIGDGKGVGAQVSKALPFLVLFLVLALPPVVSQGKGAGCRFWRRPRLMSRRRRRC